MFARLGRTVVAHPWRIIGVWVVAAVALVGFAPNLGDITETDQTAFLPARYESVQAQEIADSAFPQSTGLTALIVVKRQDDAQLTADERAMGYHNPADGAYRLETLAALLRPVLAARAST